MLRKLYKSTGIGDIVRERFIHPIVTNPFAVGLLFLLINLIVSAGAQLMLKAGMLEIGSFQFSGNFLEYALNMLTWKIIGGLFLYASGIAFWLLCLSKLELSFAYPVSTVQYILIFLGSWIFFQENIGWQRILGMLVICLGVLVISLEHRRK